MSKCTRPAGHEGPCAAVRERRRLGICSRIVYGIYWLELIAVALEAAVYLKVKGL